MLFVAADLMTDLSPSAALLLQMAGVLYGLLLAYYAFSLGRIREDIRANGDRAGVWRKEAKENPPLVDVYVEFTERLLGLYERKRRLALSTSLASAIFFVLMVIVGVQLADSILRWTGDAAIEGTSFVFIVSIAAVFAYATQKEGRQFREERLKMLNRIDLDVVSFWTNDSHSLQEFRSKWKGGQ